MPKRYGRAADKISAKVGEPFIIEIEGNATTGYRWQLDLEDDKVRLVDEQYVGRGGGAVGAGGTHVFTVEPVARGTSVIRARFKRPWDAHTPEQQEFRVDIED
jgi:predicted secreted protein